MYTYMCVYIYMYIYTHIDVHQALEALEEQDPRKRPLEEAARGDKEYAQSTYYEFSY